MAITDRRLRTATTLVAAALAVLGAVMFVAGVRGQGEAVRRPDSVAVTSSTRHGFDALAELVAASDLIVEGRVVAVEPGRVFGDVDEDGRAGRSAVRTQIATLEVRRVLTGSGSSTEGRATSVVLVEEESELADGTTIRVDGARPSRSGDRGVWFLAATGDPDFPGYVVVSSQGRYLVRDGRLEGADRGDQLVRSLEALGPDGLERAVIAAAP